MRVKTTIVLDIHESGIRQIGDWNDLSNEEVERQIENGEIMLDDLMDTAWEYYEEPCSRAVVER